MHLYSIDTILDQLSSAGRAYDEFLRVPAMSMGVYRLKVGDFDRQTPHTEDEAYFVVRGRAKFRVRDEERDVSAGDVLFVEKNIEHRFVDVTEELVLLVLFAPAEHSLRRE